MASRALEDLKTKRVALVLAGGGFKGAYQIGVWRALQVLGITRFHAIAGTSAGALNAVLVANGDFPAARDIWRHANVLRIAPRALFQLLLGYGVLLGPIPIGFAAAIGALLLGKPAAYWALGVAGVFGIAGFISSLWISMPLRARATYLFLRPKVVLAAAVLSLFVAYMASAKLGGKHDLLGGSVFAAAAIVGFVMGLVAMVTGIDLVESGRRSSRVLSNEELIELVRRNLDLERIRTTLKHLFVTTATRLMVRDPFIPNPKAERFDGNRNPYYDYPRAMEMWVPEYHDVSTETADDALEALRLSSALPLFLSGSQTPAGDVIADGGTADNIPILPVLRSGAEVLLIVCLDRGDAAKLSSPGGIQAHVQSKYVPYWMHSLTEEQSTKLYRRHLDGVAAEALIERAPSMHGLRAYVLYPEAPLETIPGLSFLSGTLNSSLPVRRKWLNQGFTETMRRLRGGHLAAVSLE